MLVRPSGLVPVFLIASLAGAAQPVTRVQLLAMAKEKVDPNVMLALVERDCVDFEVDAGSVVELSREVPAEVIEAAIRCRERATPPAPAAPPDVSPAAPAPAPGVTASPAPPAGSGSLRVSAEFIGEAGALACTCSLDGKPLAVLTKPAQGDFGQAVARDPIRRESELVPVEAGRHVLRIRCDPHGQELTREIEVVPGGRTTVEVGETMFRHWKVRRVRTE